MMDWLILIQHAPFPLPSINSALGSALCASALSRLHLSSESSPLLCSAALTHPSLLASVHLSPPHPVTSSHLLLHLFSHTSSPPFPTT